jgi:hypothetical protein
MKPTTGYGTPQHREDPRVPVAVLPRSLGPGALNIPFVLAWITSAVVGYTPLGEESTSPRIKDELLTVVIREGTKTALRLEASDPENRPVRIKVTKGPSHGTLEGTPPDLTYRPNSRFVGDDEFTWVASSGKGESRPGIVRITVSPDLRTQDLEVAGREGRPVEIVLTAANSEDRDVAFSVTVPPEHGVLKGTGSRRTYTPSAGFSGKDRLRYIASYSGFTSEPANVTLTIQPNHRPQAFDQKLTTGQHSSLGITLTGYDADGDILTFRVTRLPSIGTLEGDPPSLKYRAPRLGTGPDELLFVAGDGLTESEPATVEIEVLPYFVASPWVLALAVAIAVVWYVFLSSRFLRWQRRREPLLLALLGGLLVVVAWKTRQWTLITGVWLVVHFGVLYVMSRRAIAAIPRKKPPPSSEHAPKEPEAG